MNTFKPLTLSYLWDRENFEKAFENAYTHQYKKSARRYIGWLFLAMAQFGVVAALKGGSVALLMLSTLLILYWYVGKKWLVHRRLLRAFENATLKNKSITLHITQEGIVQGEDTFSWENLQGVVPIEDAILLYHDDEAFYIPNSAFSAYEDRGRFIALAKEKGRYFDV